MNVLGIFAKHPTPGRVKTRLAAGRGAQRAAEWYAAFIADLASRFRRTGDRRLLCYMPNESEARNYFRTVGGDDYQLWPQPPGLLGRRMSAFFEHAFSTGGERVVIIGSDSPTLPRNLVERAFHLLNDSDCVLGPATDGGFYLVGQRGRPRPIFEQVEWSSPRALGQTVARIDACAASLALLSPWYDVDTPDDLDLLRGHVTALRLAGATLDLEKTEALMANEEER